MSSLLDRLRERKLVQWALAYLAGAWVAVQLLDAVSDPFALPPALHRTILILIGIGFFISLIVAWYHGEKGRQRVSGPELLMVAALLIIAGAAISFLRPSPQPSGPPAPGSSVQGDDRPRVAVLPCDNASPNPEEAFRTSGLHDEILLKLQKISSLVSIGRTSVLRYAEMHPATAEVAEDLGVDFIGECTVQRSEARIRVIFQLLEPTGGQVWADEYNRDLTLNNILDIQIDIAEQVASAVGAMLTSGETDRLRARPTENLTAYDLFLLGRSRWMTREGPALEEAIDFFQAAILEDPSFARAYAGLAQAHMLLPIHALEPVDVHEEYAVAKEALGQAIALDPDLPEAHSALGFIAHAYDWDWAKAEQHFLRAIELDPEDAETRGWYSDLLMSLLRTEEAHEQASVAVDLDPLSWNATRALLLSVPEGELDEAESVARRFMAANPDHLYARLALSMVFVLQSRLGEAAEEAIPVFQVLGFDQPDSIRILFRAIGDPAEWDRAAAILRLLEETTPAARGFSPIFYMQIGRYDEALEEARLAVESRSYNATGLGGSGWEPLYSDPRYLALLDEVGLPHPGGEN